MKRIYFTGSFEMPDGISDAEITTRLGIKIKQLGNGTLDPKDSLNFTMTYDPPGAAPAPTAEALPSQPL